jgi:hypothetical protein
MCAGKVVAVQYGASPAAWLREEDETTPFARSAPDKCSGSPNAFPFVSFLVTSYNKSKYLPAVLASVWHEAQAVGGEIILIDDGSIDGSDQICSDFVNKHPSVQYTRQENCGIYQTVNDMAAKARGRWVRFCDSDDPLIHGSTRRLIDVAEQAAAGVAYGRGIPYGPSPVSGEHAGIPIVRNGETTVHADGVMHLIREMNFTPSMTIYSREVLANALPLPVHLISCQDLALLFPVASHTSLARVNQPVCFYLQGAPNQLSANHALTLQQTIRITQHYRKQLSFRHKRAALLKAANRTRRWLRKVRPERNSIGQQIWLLGIAVRAKLGLLNFNATIDKIAKIYERDLQPILERRAKPF